MNALHAFMDHLFGVYGGLAGAQAPYQIGKRRLFNRARLYRQHVQWLEPVLDDGWISADWQVLQQDDITGMPMPVQNETFPLVVREAALLAKVGERPYIRPSRDTPKNEKAAKLAKDVLTSHLEDIGWGDIEREGSMHCPTYGTWSMASYWDVDFTKTTRVPIEGAVKCPENGCDVKLASADLEEEEGEALARTSPAAVSITEGPNPNNQYLDPELQYKAVRCPRCQEHTSFGQRPSMIGTSGIQRLDPETGAPVTEMGEVKLPGPPKLAPFIPSEDEAMTGRDLLDRPLGDDVPIGEAMIENVSPFDANPNPSSQGIDATPNNWEEFAWAIPRSLEWIRARFPVNGWKVKAEERHEIWRYHPIIGGLGSSALTLGGPEMFQNHALVKAFVKKPYMDKPREASGTEMEGEPERNLGRLILEANHVILLDTTLEVESQNNPGTYIPRITFDWSAWELRDREAYGIGMVETLFSQQDSINTNKSQQMDARHRFANPKFLAEDGVEFTYKGGASSNYTSDYLFYRRSSPELAPPQQFEGMAPSSNVWREFDLDVNACPRLVGAAEIEGGEPPGGGVDAYSALLLLAQKASDSRKPRTERIRDMKARIFKHQLQLIHEFYREKRIYRLRQNNDKWAVKEFMGIDLLGEVDVQFDVEPVIDLGVAKREGIQLGLKLQTITADTWPAKRRINQALEISNEINDEQNLQVAGAENEGIAWLLEGDEPLIDPSKDSDEIHWQVHSESLQGEQWMNLKKACKWKQAIKVLWGWDDEFKDLLRNEIRLKAQPPTPPDPRLALLGPTGARDYTMAVKKFQADLELQQSIQRMPKPTELRIMEVWAKKLQGGGYAPPRDSEGADAFRKVFYLEAHAEAHKIRMEMKAERVASGEAIAAAPGASQTAGGLMPQPGEPATGPAAGGAGPGAVPSSAGMPS